MVEEDGWGSLDTAPVDADGGGMATWATKTAAVMPAPAASGASRGVGWNELPRAVRPDGWGNLPVRTDKGSDTRSILR